MYTKEVKKLMDMLEKSNLEAITYKDEKFEVTISKPSINMSHIVSPVQNTLNSDPTTVNTIDAPLVGVFYSRPASDKKQFFNVGEVIKEGDTVCIIEAMKVMNEIKAGKSGVLKKILVKDGDAVSYDQPLFEIS